MRIRFFIAVAALIAAFVAKPDQSLALDRLVKPAAIANVLQGSDVQIIDIRHRKLGFNPGHIPGSVSMPFWSWRAKGGGLVPDDQLTSMARRAGLDKDRPVLLVHSGLDHRSFSAASWVYWMLKSTGFNDIAILDGGVRAWKAAGYPMTTRVTKPKRSAVTLTFNDTWLATTAEVQSISDGQSKGALLDSRVQDIRDQNTIKGAMSYAMDMLMQQGRHEALDPLDTLEKLKGVEVNWEGDPVITFCNDGLQGAATWFMASEVAGIQNVRLYAASLQGWSRREVN